MSDAPIIPSFGDDEAEGGRKLAIICSKGNLDMAYPALIMANAAVGEGVETHLFFTFWGFDMITKATMDNLKFTFVGNTAMHMPGSTRSIPHMLGSVPGATAAGTKFMKKLIADLDVPDVPEFLDILSASGVKMWGCRMTVDMMKLDEDRDLYEGLDGVISAGDFIDLVEGAQLMFI